MHMIEGGLKDDMTISQGREYVNQHIKAGIKCPCCERVIKQRPRKLGKMQVENLLKLHFYPNPDHEGWVKATDVFAGGDYAKIRYWGLIEGVNGRWRVTEDGRRFLNKEIKLSEYAVVGIGGDFIGFNGDELYVQELVSGFDEMFNSHMKK